MDNAILGAEQAVLGAMLIDGDCVGDVLRRIEERDFLVEPNRKIYRAIRRLFREGRAVDGVTVAEALGADSDGRRYLAELMDITPTSANVLDYCDIQKRGAATYRLRELGRQLQEATELETCRELVAKLGQEAGGSQQVDMWSMRELLESFQAEQTDTQGVEYVKYGLPFLDEGTYTERGDVIIIGGEPSAGKSAVALQLAYYMAGRYKVGFFSLETNKKKLRDRLITNAAGIDFNAVKRRTLTEEDWEKFAKTSTEFYQRDLRVLRAGNMTVDDIENISRSMGFEVIFVDYLQLVVPENARESRAEQVAAISRSLHSFAQATDTVVVELSQFSRPEKQGAWREPTMHDLRESGQIEQDADLILLLYRPGPKSEFTDRERIRILKVDKQKEGKLGRWPLYFDGAHQRFDLLDNTPEGARMELQRMRNLAKAKKHTTAPGQEIIGQTGLHEIAETGDEPL